MSVEGDYTYLRINFYVPGSSLGRQEGNIFPNPEATFVKEMWVCPTLSISMRVDFSARTLAGHCVCLLCCSVWRSRCSNNPFLSLARLSARTGRPTWRLPATHRCPPPTCRTPSASSRRCRSATKHERPKRKRRRASSSKTRWSSTSTAATPNSKTSTSDPTSHRRGCRARWRLILMVRTAVSGNAGKRGCPNLGNVVVKTGNLSLPLPSFPCAGFRFTSVRGDKVDILYNNIKHAIFQPCDGEMIIVLHFHLKVCLFKNTPLKYLETSLSSVVRATLDHHRGSRCPQSSLLRPADWVFFSFCLCPYHWWQHETVATTMLGCLFSSPVSLICTKATEVYWQRSLLPHSTD